MFLLNKVLSFKFSHWLSEKYFDIESLDQAFVHKWNMAFNPKSRKIAPSTALEPTTFLHCPATAQSTPGQRGVSFWGACEDVRLEIRQGFLGIMQAVFCSKIALEQTIWTSRGNEKTLLKILGLFFSSHVSPPSKRLRGKGVFVTSVSTQVLHKSFEDLHVRTDKNATWSRAGFCDSAHLAISSFRLISYTQKKKVPASKRKVQISLPQEMGEKNTKHETAWNILECIANGCIYTPYKGTISIGNTEIHLNQPLIFRGTFVSFPGRNLFVSTCCQFHRNPRNASPAMSRASKVEGSEASNLCGYVRLPLDQGTLGCTPNSVPMEFILFSRGSWGL